jgi:hypothetical protein
MMQGPVKFRLALFVALGVFVPFSCPRAEEPALKGQLTAPSGQAIQGFPVIVESTHGRYVTTTDESGNFSVFQLPPGKYSVAPANEPALMTNVTIERKTAKWYEFWKKNEVKPMDIGKIEIETGKKY